MIHGCKIFKRYLSIYPDRPNKEAYIFTQRTGRGKYALYQDYQLVRPHITKDTMGSLMINIYFCPWCGKQLERETPKQRELREKYDKELLKIK
jgi:hypothetical protein